MKYIEKYYQDFMNKDQKNKYKLLKQKRTKIIKKDPGEWKLGNVCSFTEAKRSNPELFKWYVLKSKINHKIYIVEDDIRDLELQIIENMEEKICNPGNMVIYRKPPTSYYKSLSFLVMEKSGRDSYLLFNSVNNRLHKIHWKCLVKEYKLSEISE